MRQLTPDQIASLRHWFVPDQPGPQIGLHVIQSKFGTAWADRWPNPQAIFVETAQNAVLHGDPAALTPTMIRDVVTGFVTASPAFVPLLKATFPDLVVWDRVIYALPAQPHYLQPVGFSIRRLTAPDAGQLENLSTESFWISKTWGGPAGLAASGYAWGAFAGERLAAVANTFFLGDHYEDLGVVTEPEFRGRGLSVACSGLLCDEILARGRIPSWTTSPDNTASLRVAEKLGFTFVRNDYVYVIDIPIPEPAQAAKE